MTARAPLLHVIGAGPWQVPTIRRARDLGLRVLATDGHADRPGYAYADVHETADITDPEATLAAARRHAIDGVLCDTTDNGVLAAAHVADRLGLPGVGVAAARNCTDKSRMTACAAWAGLPVPRSMPVRSPADLAQAVAALGLPAVVKPVDNQSGRGVTVVHDPDALTRAFSAAMAHSRSRTAVVQRFVAGTEIIVDSIVDRGRVHRLGIAVKTPYPDNSTVASRITYGCRELPAPASRIDAVNEAMIGALGLRQGLVHAEYIVGGDGVVPIDVAARGGGVMIYTRALPALEGVDVVRAAIDLALGRAPDLQPARPPRAVDIEFLRMPPGRIVAIEGVDAARALPGVLAIHLNAEVGDRVEPLANKEHRFGFVLAAAGDAPSAIEVARRAAASIDIRLDTVEGVCP